MLQEAVRGARWLLPLFLLAAYGSGAAGQVPYFHPSVPPHEHVFYVVPGELFTGLSNIEVWSDGVNASKAGTIAMASSGVTVPDARVNGVNVREFEPVRISRSAFVGPTLATKGLEPSCVPPVNPDDTTTTKCSYYCLETPLYTGPGCAAWPSQQLMTGGSTFSYRYQAVGGRTYTNRSVFSYTLQHTNAQALLTQGPPPSKLLSIDNPYRRVCLKLATVLNVENQVTATGPERCWNIVYRVPATLASCDYDLQKPRIPCARDIFPTSRVVKVAIGQTMRANVYFSAPASDAISIAVQSNPGLPNGATIGPIRGGPNEKILGDYTWQVTSGGSSSLVRYLYSREITFTPGVMDGISVDNNPESGITYTVCFSATSTPMNGTASSLANPPECTQIVVMRPEPDLNMAVSCPSCPSALDEMAFTAMVRCPYTWNMEMKERKDFDPAMSIDGAGTIPAVGFPEGFYRPRAMPDPENPLPEGAVLGEPRAVRVCQDGGTCGNDEQRFVWIQSLTWTPPRGLEGSSVDVCFMLVGAEGITAGSERRCSKIYVSKCRVCTLPEDTLQSIAKEYRTDWLQLWGANVNVEDPNNLAAYGNITLGPTYVVSKESESARIIHLTYGMTEEGMAEVNPDLKGMTTLGKTTEVCIVPPVCHGPPTLLQPMAI